MRKQQNSLKGGMDILSSVNFLLHNAFQDARRRWCSYCLSFFSVMIVVAASAVSQTIIDRAPLIFLKSAEGPASETDIILTPESTYLTAIPKDSPMWIEANMSDELLEAMQSLLNMTRINEVIGEDKKGQATSRIVISSNLTSCANDSDIIKQNINDYIMGSPEQITEQQNIFSVGNEAVCSLQKYSIDLSVIDTEQERKIELGREYPFQKLKQHECLISNKLAYDVNLKIGDYILVEGNFYLYHSMYAEHWYNQQYGYSDSSYDYNLTIKRYLSINAASKIYIPLQVKGILSESYGKYSDGGINKLIIIEKDSFFKNLAYWGQNLDYSNDMFKAEPTEFSPEIRINMPNRLDIYMNSNYETIQFHVSKYASQIRRNLGVYPFTMSLPILEQLYSLRFGQMFLGIILNMIIVILFLLSIVLLYNLLLISVETKTYEMGVLRVLGFNKLGVIFLILIQAMSYVIPAIICGMILSIPFLLITANLLQSAIGVKFDIYPTGNAVGISLLLGFLIPLISSISPIKEALKQQLSFALDLNRSKSSAVKIEVDVEGKSLPWGRIYFALVASAFGVSIYFLLPLALLSFNIALLLAIFFLLLCSMLLGFVLLTFNFQYLMERLIVAIFFIWASASTKTLILKNLASHRIKNRRTALMYSLSISFVIFISTGMSVQIMNQMYQTLQVHGTTMEVYAPKWTTLPLPMIPFENLLDSLSDHVDDHAWITYALDVFMKQQGYETVYITHVGKLYELFPNVVGVSPSLFKMGFDDFLTIDRRGTQTGLDPVEELYTPRGSQSCLMGTAYTDYLHLDVGDDSKFLMVVYNNTYSKIHQMGVSSIIKSAPALTFSIIPSVLVQSVVVSLPTYIRLTNGEIFYFSSLPMQRLLLKFKQDANLDYVYTEINKFIQNQGITANIWDFRDYQKSLEKNQSLITIIFTALTAIVMVLCFFSLSSSMSANLLEQAKEIAVLRAIGNSKLTLTLLYIYESFVLVLSSSLIGLFVGYCIGYTMALQQTLITQLPLFFVFPWQLLIAVIIVSIICAILSTYFPAYRILKNEIAIIMRMNS